MTKIVEMLKRHPATRLWSTHQVQLLIADIERLIDEERERWARLCDEQAELGEKEARWGQVVRARVCAETIRARSNASSEYKPETCANCGCTKMKQHFWGSRDGCQCGKCPGFMSANASSTPQAD